MTDKELAQIIWDYMRYEQPLEKADLILGLGSHDILTAEWCAKLWHDGWSKTILFTGGFGRLTEGAYEIEEAERYKKRALELGVPEKCIFVEPRAAGTGQNFTLSYDVLKSKNITPRSMIIVTKPYMLRRAYATFMKQWPQQDKPKPMMSAIDMSFDDYCKLQGALFEHVTNIMVGDLQRIMEYPKLGFQIEQDIPENVRLAFEELVKRGYNEWLLRK